MDFWRSVRKECQYCLAGVFLFGLFAHGFAFTNKLVCADEATYTFSIGRTFELGRFTLGLIEWLLNATVGKYSMPFFSGILSLCFIGLSCCLMMSLLKIRDPRICFLSGAIMAVYPTVTNTFCYMYTAPSYFLSLLLILLSVYFFSGRKLISLAAGVFLTVLSLGIYQAYLAVGIVVIMLILMRQLIDPGTSDKDVFLSAARYGVGLTVSLLTYLLVMKACISAFHINLMNYQGAGSILSFNIPDRLYLVMQCYKNLIKMAVTDVQGLSSVPAVRLSIILMLCLIILLGIIAGRQGKGLRRVLYFVLMALLPVGLNFVYPMTSRQTTVYPLMRYSLCLLWIIPMYFMTLIEHAGKEKEDSSKGTIRKALTYSFAAAFGVTLFVYCHLANAVYFKTLLMQNRAELYYASLITRIKSMDGYHDEYPVAFVGVGHQDKMYYNEDQFPAINILFLDEKPMVYLDLYDGRRFLENFLGFAPEWYDGDLAPYLDEIDEMSVYPDDGSVRIIDDKIFVNFGDYLDE